MKVTDLEKYFTLKSTRVCGVYFLIKNGKIIYIGQTSHFPTRLYSHGDKNYDKIRFIQCPPRKLSYYERRWIQKFRPKLNKTGHIIDGVSISISIPMQLWRRIDREARRLKISFNQLVIRILEKQFVNA